MVKSKISLHYLFLWICKSGSTIAFVILLFLSPRFSIIPFAIILFGGYVNVFSYWQLKNSGENAVVKHGMYRFVRHPMYLGELLLGIGMTTMLSSYIGIIVLAIQIIGIVGLVYVEEKRICDTEVNGLSEWHKKSKRLIPKLW